MEGRPSAHSDGQSESWSERAGVKKLGSIGSEKALVARRRNFLVCHEKAETDIQYDFILMAHCTHPSSEIKNAAPVRPHL